MPRSNTDVAKHTLPDEVKNISAKRLFRGVMECVRKLDSSRQHRRNLISLFQPEQVKMRHKLREACERLMFSYPSEYGKRAEELLWKKVYYDVIHAIKAGRKFQSNAPGTLQQRHLEPNYRQFLFSAVGFYHYLLLRLQSKFDCSVLQIDYPLASRDSRHNSTLSSNRGLSTSKSTQESGDKNTDEWIKNTAYRIFLCLGDLSRYQMEFDVGRFRPIRYYQLALLARPNAGMPHNQLATIAGHSSWWGLTAAYHYCRALHADSTFEGAEGNIQTLLDRNKRLFYQLPTDALDSVMNADVYKKEHTRIFIISFLYMCDLLRPKTYATDAETTGLCTRLIHALHVCLSHMDSDIRDNSNLNDDFSSYSNERFFTRKQKSDSKRYGVRTSLNSMEGSPASKVVRHHQHTNQQRLTGDVVFKICVMCLANVHDLQTCRSGRSSAAIVFTLAFFSHLLDFLIRRLTKPVKKSKESSQNQGKENGEHLKADGDNVSGSKEENAAGKSKKNKSRMRRRRRVGGRTNRNDLSEGEEDAMGGGDATASDSESSASDDDEESDTLSESTESENRLSQEDLSSQDDGEVEENGFFSQTNDDPDLKKEDSSSGVGSPPSIAIASLQDLSNKMFQPPNRRKITLAPSFLQHLTPTKEISSPSKSNNDSADDSKSQDSPRKDPATNEEPEIKTANEKKEKIVMTNKESEAEKLKRENQSLEYLNLLARYHHVVAAVKLLSDWLAMNEGVAAACAKNSRSLWSRLVCLLNLLPTERAMMKSDHIKSDSLCMKQIESVLSNLEVLNGEKNAEDAAEEITIAKEESSKDEKIKIEKRSPTCPGKASVKKPEWRIAVGMPEDHAVHMMKAVKESAIKTGVTLSQPYNELTDLQQCVVRVCRLRHLCRFLSTIEGVEIEVESSGNEVGDESFVGPEEELADPQMELEAVETMRKTRLMKDMAASRLRNEVQALESSLGTTKSRDSALCLYLVPDTATLCTELPQVRRLVASERFFVVITKTVLDGLDSLKKEQQGARDAIRYLEAEFKRSNRFIRAQGHDQVVRLTANIEKPKLRRNDPTAWSFYRIIECCRYLIQQEAKKTNTEVKDHTGLIAILTKITDDSNKNLQDARTAAKSLGIQVASATSFCKSWSK